MVNNNNNDMHKVSSEDSQLFRDSIGAVKPVEHDGARLQRQKPRPVPAQSHADDQAVMQQLHDRPFAVALVETGDELSYLRPGIQKQLLRKLKRGQIAIQLELDLHGMYVRQARPAVKAFISDCMARGIHAVRIIHGKGRGSRDRTPVLKNKLNKWLQLDEHVLAFCSARPVDGGTGAVYVLLRRG